MNFMKKKILKFIALVSGFISAWAAVALGITCLKEAKNRIKGAGEFSVGGVSGSVDTTGKRSLKFSRKRKGKGLIGAAISFLKFILNKLFKIFLKRVLHIPFVKV